MKLRVHATRDFYTGGISLFIAHRSDDGAMYVAKPAEFERLEPGYASSNPILSLSIEDAQLIIDELWNVGLRPSEGTGSAGALAASERHLADMRAIAFHSLGVTKP